MCWSFIVVAITEFDPYDPPVVGIAAQIYGYGGHDRLWGNYAGGDRSETNTIFGGQGYDDLIESRIGHVVYPLESYGVRSLPIASAIESYPSRSRSSRSSETIRRTISGPW